MNCSPDDIVLHPIPFIGTLGHVEFEFSAAVLVRVCQFRGFWGPVRPREVGELIRAETNTGQDHPWWSNPILLRCFDFYGLVNGGFARFTEEKGIKGQYELGGQPLELTPKFFKQIGGYIRRAA